MAKDTNAFVCSNCGTVTNGNHSCGARDNYPNPGRAVAQQLLGATECELDRLREVLERIRDGAELVDGDGRYCQWCGRSGNDMKHCPDCPARMAAEALRRRNDPD